MCYNSYFDTHIKQSFAVFAPAFMCVCVCVIELVSAGVCRVTQSARRCLSLSTADRHAGPPGGKMGLQLSVPLRRAERQACDFCSYMFPSAAHMLSAALLCKGV